MKQEKNEVEAEGCQDDGGLLYKSVTVIAVASARQALKLLKLIT